MHFIIRESFDLGIDRPLGPISERRLSIVGGLMVAVGPLSITMYTPAVPQIVIDLGTTEAALKGTISVFFAGFALAQLVCGTLSDGLGRRPVALAFFAFYVLATLVALVAPTIEVLMAARLMQGIGAAAGISISRALVRDMFTGQQSSRLLNAMAIIIAAGPAVAPTLGSIALLFGGYHAIFLLMLFHGLSVIGLIYFLVPETVSFDPGRIRLKRLVATFGALFKSREFLLPTIAVSGVTGSIYGQATLLPFILITRVGMTPLQFGMSMFMQSGMYMLGSLSARYWLHRVDAVRLVPFGLIVTAFGAAVLAFDVFMLEPGFFSIMVPVALIAFGSAHSNPCFMTASFSPFPTAAGAASSLNGFMQLATGFLAGMLAIFIGDPLIAMGIVIPGLIAIGCICGLIWYGANAHQSPV